MVSEYTHTSLSAGQQSALVEAFGLLSIRQHNGISVGSVLLVNEERVAGMARCVVVSRNSTVGERWLSRYASNVYLLAGLLFATAVVDTSKLCEML